MKVPASLVAMLEIAFNRAIAYDTDTQKKLIALQGKVIAVELRGLDLRIYFMPAGDGVQLSGDYEGEPDTVISGTPGRLLHVALTQDRKPLFEGEVAITGDIELGQRFNRILENLDIDWEEPLSQLVGDVAAHQLGQAARSMFSFFENAVRSLAKDTAEYIQEEQHQVPSPYEVKEFVENVDELRSHVDRVEARINHLQARIKGENA